VSALPARGPDASRAVPGSIAAAQWAQLRAAAPQVTAVIQRYLQRLAVFLAPGSVDAAENALRQFARWMITDAGLDSIAAVRRDDIEDYKVWLAAQPRAGGKTITKETHRQRMRTVRAFFERIIEWDWPDAPPRNPVIAGDIPKKPEPLPKFLDDRDAARLMTAARASTDPRDPRRRRAVPPARLPRHHLFRRGPRQRRAPRIDLLPLPRRQGRTRPRSHRPGERRDRGDDRPGRPPRR